MLNYPKTIYENFEELFKIADEVDVCARSLLDEFNARDIKLFDLPTYQRIFLFIITRSIKTFSSILILCKHGYGQDVSPLLRNLLENLITARFILHDRKTADDKAARFVAFKWVIFKRHLPEQEKQVRTFSVEAQKDFFQKRDLILKNVEDFKNKFGVTSDRALLTWSGKTTRDMAKDVDRLLLEEYETTFRLCSRFSHPSILGDQEYVIQGEKNLTFSPLPSKIGIEAHLKNTIKYTLDFLYLIDDMFQFKHKDQLKTLEEKHDKVYEMEKYRRKDDASPHKAQQKSSSIRESRIVFKTTL